MRGRGRREPRLDPVRWRRPGRATLLRSAVVAVLIGTAAVVMWARPGACEPGQAGCGNCARTAQATAADDRRLGAAGDRRLGAADDPRLGATDDPRLGATGGRSTAGVGEMDTATEPRQAIAHGRMRGIADSPQLAAAHGHESGAAGYPRTAGNPEPEATGHPKLGTVQGLEPDAAAAECRPAGVAGSATTREQDDLPPAVAAAPGRSGGSPGAIAVPPGSIGVPIRLAEPTALRLIHPGDHVDVFRLSSTGESPQAIATAALVLEVTGAEDPTSGGLLLALTPIDARRAVTTPGGGYAVLIRPDG